MKQQTIIIFILLFFGCVASASAFTYTSGYMARTTSSGLLHTDSRALWDILSGGSSFFSGPGMAGSFNHEAHVFTLTLSSMSGKNSKITFGSPSIFPIKKPVASYLLLDMAGKEDTIGTMLDNTGDTGQNTGIGEGETPTMDGTQQDGENNGEVTHNATASPVPEPATLFLLGVGLLGAGWYSRKKPAHG